ACRSPATRSWGSCPGDRGCPSTEPTAPTPRPSLASRSGSWRCPGGRERPLRSWSRSRWRPWTGRSCCATWPRCSRTTTSTSCRRRRGGEGPHHHPAVRPGARRHHASVAAAGRGQERGRRVRRVPRGPQVIPSLRIVLQRVSRASVRVGGELIAEIGRGFLLLVGVGLNERDDEPGRLAEKVFHLRVFEDRDGKMNLALTEVGASVMVVPQFTLYGDWRRGRRPSWAGAAPPERAAARVEELAAALE